MGSFFYYGKKDGLIQYEKELPSKYKDMNLKGLCIYHKQDYDRSLNDKEKQTLIEHHGKTLILLPSPTSS
jgi:hypothetical protein